VGKQHFSNLPWQNIENDDSYPAFKLMKGFIKVIYSVNFHGFLEEEAALPDFFTWERSRDCLYPALKVNSYFHCIAVQ
jgi:hypothetical protein